jgi:sec-independent protein translocase protein TatB
MFDIGWSELLVIAVVAIIVVGPRDLPRMLRTVGQSVGKVRRMAGDFRSQFDDALKEAELDDLKKDVDSLRSLNPANALKKEIGSINEIGKDIKKSVEAPVNLDSQATAMDSPVVNGATPTSGEIETAPSTTPARSRPARPSQSKAKSAGGKGNAKSTGGQKKAKPKRGKSEVVSSS